MKTKNLTAWCNLFSAESKHNLTIGASKLSTVVNACLYILMPVLILAYFHHQLDFPSYLYWLFVPYIALIAYSERNRFQNQKTVIAEISVDGEYCWLTNVYQISKHSRVGWLGVSLVLVESKPNKQKSLFSPKHKRIFIYKDSLSVVDYARLCRIVLKLAGEHTLQPTVSNSQS